MSWANSTGAVPRSTIWPMRAFAATALKAPTSPHAIPRRGALVALFNPRTDHWSAHFQLSGAEVIPLTPVGRGTAVLLRFNDEQRVLLREELLRQGRYTPPSSS